MRCGTLLIVRTVRLYDASRRPHDWMEIIEPGQYAVFASLLDGGAPAGTDGILTTHEAATCVIVDSPAEAEALCRHCVERQPAVRFDIFDSAGRGRPPLLTVVHPSRESSLEGHVSSRRRNVVIAGVLMAAAPVLFWIDWRSDGLLIYPTLAGFNALLFAGRLLQLNAAAISAERARAERAVVARHSAS